MIGKRENVKLSALELTQDKFLLKLHYTTLMKKNILILILFCCFSLLSNAQSSIEAKEIIDSLTSTFFNGRGYTKSGMQKSADYLKTQYMRMGLAPFGSEYIQTFYYPVNTFPDKMMVTIDHQLLIPGKDFIVSAESKGLNSKGKLIKKDSTTFVNQQQRLIIKLEDKLTWSVSKEETNYTVILIDKKALKREPKSFNVNVENKYVPNFSASNVCGLIKGTDKPDSLIFITAHYDHLGGMGNSTYFPGANDNASGIALLLSLAKHYSIHPPSYSIAFICFAGEEAGLIGSKYFTEHPLVELKKIKFLINIDLVGTGEEGITVVNGRIYEKQFQKLVDINNKDKYITKINSRGKAANSDHYWFTEKGVPAFFIYTLGGIKAYHDVNDRAETLPLTEFDDLQHLLIKFSNEVMGD
ncbi:MAG: family peptidase [Daejeonella sp.]|nr:family peptidase [Daejeonella sp.]